jgi:hypothetical protein
MSDETKAVEDTGGILPSAPRRRRAAPPRWLLLLLLPFAALAIAIAAMQMGYEPVAVVAFITAFVLFAALALVFLAAKLLLFLAIPIGALGLLFGAGRRISGASAPAPASAAALPPALVPIADEMEALRVRTDLDVRRRLWIFCGIAVALVALASFLSPPPAAAGVPSFVVTALFFAGAVGIAWLLAAVGPNSAYAAAFKARVLPALVADHGALSLGEGPLPDFAFAATYRLVPLHTAERKLDDRIHGTYRGRDIRLAEVRLRRSPQVGKDRYWRGLVGEIALVGAAPGSLVLLPAGRKTSALPALALDDPAFEAVYAAFGSDAGATRLLDAATRARLLGLKLEEGFIAPGLFVSGRRLVFALESPGERDVLEPASLSENTAAAQIEATALVVGRVFAMIDAFTESFDPAAGTA